MNITANYKLQKLKIIQRLNIVWLGLELEGQIYVD